MMDRIVFKTLIIIIFSLIVLISFSNTSFGANIAGKPDIMYAQSHQTLSGFINEVTAIEWSPRGDKFVCASSSLNIWNYETGTMLGEFGIARGTIRTISWSPDGKTIAMGTNNGKIRIYNSITWVVEQEFDIKNAALTSLDWSPDGKRLAAGGHKKGFGFKKTPTVWVLKPDLANIERIIQTTSGSVRSLDWSPNSNYLAIGLSDNSIIVVDGNTGEKLKEFIGHSDRVNSVEWNPSGRMIASASNDGTIKIWDFMNGNLISTFEEKEDNIEIITQGQKINRFMKNLTYRPRNAVNVARWNNECTIIASGSNFGSISMWNVADSEKLYSLFGHTKPVMSISWHPKDNFIVSGSKDRTVKIWKEGRPLIVSSSIEREENNPTEFDTSEPIIPQFPADLVVENLRFYEPSDNRALDADETGEIRFTIRNKGWGIAQNVKINLTPLFDSEELKYDRVVTLNKIDSESAEHIIIKISASRKIHDIEAKFRIQFDEYYGYVPDPAYISFGTRAFQPPDLRVEQVAIDDGMNRARGSYGNSNSIIEPGESVSVTAYIQNFGTGEAQNVMAKIRLDKQPGDHIYYPDEGREYELGTIAPGDYKSIQFYFNSSGRFSKTDIPLVLEISESRADLKIEKSLGLKMGTKTKNIVEVDIDKLDMPEFVLRSIDETFRSDVDVVEDRKVKEDENAIAVIIGIENYRNAPKASYANRDATTFLEYATKLFGVPDRNINIIIDEEATKAEFDKLFGSNGWIKRRITPGKSKVYIFYAGHGIPEIKGSTPQPYILPYDADPNYVTETGIPLSWVYTRLAELEAADILMFNDACFSGSNREGDMLIANARPILRRVDPIESGNLTVFSAASSGEISSGFKEQRHGLFSYYLFKGLKESMADVNKDRIITVAELHEFIRANVTKAAILIDREQTPTLQTPKGNMKKTMIRF